MFPYWKPQGTHLHLCRFNHIEPEDNLGNVLPVGKIGVSLVRFSPGDVPVTQEAVLAHVAAVSRGGYDKSLVKGKRTKLFRLPHLESGGYETTSVRAGGRGKRSL